MPNRFLLANLLVLVTVSPAFSTVLTFDQGQRAGTTVNLDTAYGDRVSAATMGMFSYGTDGGFTPNVVVDYGPDSNFTIWPDNYGDLINVLEYEPEASGPFSVTFTADPGYSVRLVSFDLGGWSNTDYILPMLQVLSGDSILFSASNVLVQGNFAGPRHTTVDSSFAGFTGYNAQSLTIVVHQQGLGSASDNIGIDNILFTQAGFTQPVPTGHVPEPSTVLMFTSAFAILVVSARWRRNRRR